MIHIQVFLRQLRFDAPDWYVGKEGMSKTSHNILIAATLLAGAALIYQKSWTGALITVTAVSMLLPGPVVRDIVQHISIYGWPGFRGFLKLLRCLLQKTDGETADQKMASETPCAELLSAALQNWITGMPFACPDCKKNLAVMHFDCNAGYRVLCFAEGCWYFNGSAQPAVYNEWEVLCQYVRRMQKASIRESL